MPDAVAFHFKQVGGHPLTPGVAFTRASGRSSACKFRSIRDGRRLARKLLAVRTVLAKNPNWWGEKNWPIDIDEVVFSRIENAATRAAALLSGQLDMV
jgi:hypothetical protein